MKNSRKLGVAIIGLGVGEQHARAYAADRHCQVRWIYDLDSNRSERLAQELPSSRVAPSYQFVLENSEVDIVSIASFDDAHFEQVRSALKAGKHVFVEKPLCQTMNQLRIIKKAWSDHKGKLKLASNLILRAAPIYKWLKNKIGAGDFGEIYAFDGDYLYGRLSKITEGWRAKVNNYSVMQGGGVHMLDLMLWLTGQRPATVYANGNRICTRETAFQYNDYVTATFQFASTMIGKISANFGCVHRHQHVLRIFGTKATFLYDDAGPRLHFDRDPAVTADLVNLATLPAKKGDLIPDFISAVVKDEDLSVDTQTFFDGISIAIACHKSLSTNSHEEVKYA